MKSIIFVASSLVLLASGCDDSGEDGPAATVEIDGVAGQSISGSGRFTSNGGSVTLRLEFSQAPEGTHGSHIHETPACGNDGADAGAHWDPADSSADAHGLPPEGHLGDLGNIEIDEDGTGTLTIKKDQWKVGDGTIYDVNNHAIIFHELEDDGTMPSAGARWGCGIISLAATPEPE